MPIINVVISSQSFQGEVNNAAIGKISERLTESAVKVLRKKRELVVVKVDVSQSSWYAAGLVNQGPLYEVEIKVTEGANTHEEVSTWIREAYETLNQEIGESSGPSYISVQQIPKEFWGYNGLTQYGRQKWGG